MYGLADTLHALAHPDKRKDAAEFAYFSSRCDAVLVGLCLWREGLGVHWEKKGPAGAEGLTVRTFCG